MGKIKVREKNRKKTTEMEIARSIRQDTSSQNSVCKKVARKALPRF